MRRLVPIAVLLTLGCPVDDDSGKVRLNLGFGFHPFVDRDSFNDRVLDKLCEGLERCQSDFSCEDIGTPGTGTNPSCDFDRDAARQCLNDPWPCEPQSGFPIAPDVCGQVFFDCQSSTFTTY